MTSVKAITSSSRGTIGWRTPKDITFCPTPGWYSLTVELPGGTCRIVFLHGFHTDGAI